MKQMDISKIKLADLRDEIVKHENEWIAISEENTIVGWGKTPKEVHARVSSETPVVLFRVPRLDVSYSFLKTP